MREYEFTFVTKADLVDGEKSKVLEGYEQIVQRDGGEILKKEEWGTRKMAYPIQNHFRGHYVHYDLATQPEHIAECERLLRIDENILRYLVIKVGEDIDIESRKTELSKESKAPERSAKGE